MQLTEPWEGGMRDVIFVLLTIGFFVLMAFIARGSEKL